MRVTVNGKRLYAMIYIMNEDRNPYGEPSPRYFFTILTGYKNNRKSITFLHFMLAFLRQQSDEWYADKRKETIL